MFRLTKTSLILITALSALWSSATYAQERSFERIFEESSRAYDSSNYMEAIAGYHEILDSGWESPELYFNLGNTYFKSGDLGHAILNFLRAKRLDPTDPDIQENLEFARNFVTVQMEGVRLNPLTDMLSALTGGRSLEFWGWLTTLALALFSTLIIILALGGARSGLLKLGAWSAAIFLITITSLTTFKYRTEFSASRAVVVFPDLPVTDRPSDDGDQEFIAAAGMEVDIINSSGEYFLAQFENKRIGWLKASALERL